MAACGSTSSWRTSAVSATGRCTCTTEPGAEGVRARCHSSARAYMSDDIGRRKRLRRRSEAVAPHHRRDRGKVWRTAGRCLDDRGELAEVGRPQNARSDDRKRRRVDVAEVVEAVNDATRDAENLAGP